MTSEAVPSKAVLDKLREYDSCTLSNAIERFGVRLRNEGFIHGTAHCQFPHLPPVLGYAVTGRIRASLPRITGGWYYDRMDWWRHIASIPAPRMIVMQDIDPVPGIGAFFGELHANICRALDCVGYVTNGAVRDLTAVESIGFQLFAGSVGVSHAYAHVVDFGDAVEIGGLRIQPGDLLYGDQCGVLAIPLTIAAEVPRVAEELLAHEREIIELCRSREFSLEKLASFIRGNSPTSAEGG